MSSAQQGTTGHHRFSARRDGATARLLRRPSARAAGIWSAVYAIAWSTGQRYSTDFLHYGYQIVPYPTLRADPFGSVWYLHIQPPLWNLVLGVFGRWSPLPTAITLQLLAVLLGALLAGTLCSLLGRIDVPPGRAVVIALIATVNPSVLKLAFDAQYELAVALALVVLLWALAGGPTTSAARRLVIISVMATSIVMTRSLFHPVWLVLFLAPVLYGARRLGRRLSMAGAVLIPLVVVGGWIVKNDVLFSEPSLSSWTGMNLLHSIAPTIPAAELRQLAADGSVSPVTTVGAFQPYSSYAGSVATCVPRHDNPAASEAVSTAPSVGFDGKNFYTPNFNDECFIPLYRLAGDDAQFLAFRYPYHWLAAREWSARAWFGSGFQNGTSPSIVLRGLDGAFAVARADLPAPQVSSSGWQSQEVYGKLGREDVSWSVLGCSLLVLITGASEVIRRARGRSTFSRRSSVLAASAFILAWTFVTGVVGELGEQGRFRTMTDPLVVALGLVIVASIVDRRRRHPVATSDQPDTVPVWQSSWSPTSPTTSTDPRTPRP